MSRLYDCIVIGAGSFGASAGMHLAREGAHVLLLDMFHPPHGLGSHHGDTRIFRTAYTMGSAYVCLAERARVGWLHLEEEARRHLGLMPDAANRAGSSDEQPEPFKLFLPTGVISVGDAHSEALANKEASCVANGVAYERWDDRETKRRLPALYVPAHYEVLYEPEGGVLFSERIIESYLKLAEAYGAEWKPNHPVQRIATVGNAVVVWSGNERFVASKVLVTTGAWLPRLLPSLGLPVQAERRAVAWFEDTSGSYSAERFPAFIVHQSTDSEYYGLPSVRGSGIKIGHHQQGQPWNPDEEVAPFGSCSGEERLLSEFTAQSFPEAGRCMRGAACMYEMTPSEHFIIDRHPDEPAVWFAGGGSGHGFKFASAIGETVSRWMLHGKREPELEAFSLACTR
ncbi:N-methyl-L-tryptophan oxidase [Paenibacillus sp. MER TA 81-3]|uniref:N-methyl-L-tryptophan oxidase n=1 Tax=Paenibacillus sp. MER TA 81-3 TaxID=2939573 RepID=UPI002041A54A|nr:N-methyl-L-tryptophan oxidase [Paenibacillus sp. MER TA 81-3]MCM3342238.1 N-methyl-L-tryptophan oxidase [Paenibacillus sp. MER TA 81-3]